MSDIVKWSLADLAIDNNQKMPFELVVNFTKDDFINIERLRRLAPFLIKGIWYYDEVDDCMVAEFDLSGEVTVACSISLEDVDVPITYHAKEKFSFETDERFDSQVIDDNVDLEEIIKQIIVSQIPIKVVKDGIEYPSGKDWKVISESDFNNEPKEIDPRLAKLLEFKIDD